MISLRTTVIAGIFFLTSLLSCDRYLDVKPDQKMAIPKSLDDVEAILNRVDALNASIVPDVLEFSGDNFYLPKSEWSAIGTVQFRNAYLWDSQPLASQTWNAPYQAVFYANTALDELLKIEESNPKDAERKKVLKGRALFFRGYSFFKLAIAFSASYDNANSQKPGIVLRLDSDINKPSIRSNVKDSYQQILKDLIDASELLPMTSSFKTQPNKVAAYAALAQVNMCMRNYPDASRYAKLAYENYPDRLDFNILNPSAAYPFERYNKDVLFYCAISSNPATSRLRISEELYNSYADDDLRKHCLYNRLSTGGYSFKGNYAQNNTTYFAGITIGDVQLMLAETAAREGDLERTGFYLTDLAINRYRTGKVPVLEFQNKEEALTYVLNERRKELAFKGYRWADIRRLSKDIYADLVLERVWDGDIVASLSSKECFDYVHLIPDNVMIMVDFEQNSNNR